MGRIKAPTLSLNIDGKNIDIKKRSKRNFDLNKALLNPDDFQKFTADPRKFAAKYDFDIDNDISTALSARLDGIQSREDLMSLLARPDVGPVSATAWAVASGLYSIASTKIAVAF